MRFELIDEVLERSDERIVATKHVSASEDYLADHFPGFPLLPGVLMLETMVQAARCLLRDCGGQRLVLGEVRALKYGSMVRPGDVLRVEVTARREVEGVFACRGTGTVERRAPAGRIDTAVSGRFTLRPIRVGGR